MKVRFLDLRIHDADQKKLLLDAIERVFDHGIMINGPELQAFEKKVAAFCNRNFAIGVNSGTGALFLALKSLGIGKGDEVITTSLSWIATANAIALTGASPVFADIDNDLNISPDSVKKIISKHTKAILPVHYTGKICSIEDLQKIANENNIYLIEDAAQAFGAKRKNIIAGAFGDLACFSMNSMKIFASCGEAGIILTDNEKLCDHIFSLRYNGTINKETCIEPSLNARLDTIQAAILLERIKDVPRIIDKRREIAKLYNKYLEGIVKVPNENDEEYCVYYTYTIQASKRNELQSYLLSKGIETKIQHPILMPDQPAYNKEKKGNIDNAKKIVNKILSLPANEKISFDQVKYVSDCIKYFYNKDNHNGY